MACCDIELRVDITTTRWPARNASWNRERQTLLKREYGGGIGTWGGLEGVGVLEPREAIDSAGREGALKETGEIKYVELHFSFYEILWDGLDQTHTSRFVKAEIKPEKN